MQTQTGYGFGYVIREDSANWLVGRVLTIIEALGLKDSQEKSLKDLLRNEIYKLHSREEDALFISPNLNEEIHRVYKELEDEQRKECENNYPISLSTNYKFKITYEEI